MRGLLRRLRERRRRRNAAEEDAVDPNAVPSFDFPTIAIQASQRLNTADYEMEEETQDPSEEPASLPLLYSLARSWAWQAVWFRCRTHPEEASPAHVDANGDNVLHWAAFGSGNQDAMRELLSVCPDLAAHANNKGFYPLHGEYHCLFDGIPNSLGIAVKYLLELETESHVAPFHHLYSGHVLSGVCSRHTNDPRGLSASRWIADGKYRFLRASFHV